MTQWRLLPGHTFAPVSGVMMAITIRARVDAPPRHTLHLNYPELPIAPWIREGTGEGGRERGKE